LTTTNDEFSAALLESMDEAIRSLLSQQVADALHQNLRNNKSIEPEDIPQQLPTVSIVLKKYFGPSANTLEKAIARRLYSKYGLEFQSNRDYQLKDYVENARNKLKSAAPIVQPRGGRLPMKEDFDPLLVESVREAIEDALGKDTAKSAFLMLERDVAFDNLPQRLPSFYIALNRLFGKDHGTIETAIARKLYRKLSLEFTETPNTELAKYIERAIDRLSRREPLGFNISSEDGRAQ
jgi:hypothetical protein